jgi:hypothetical protein
MKKLLKVMGYGKDTGGIEPLLGNGSVNKHSQQQIGCFLRCPCRGVIKGKEGNLRKLSRTGSSSGDGSGR